MHEAIGQGSYASVKLASLKRDPGQQFAVKVYRNSVFQDMSKKTNLENEIAILSGLQHANIVKLISSVQAEHHLFIIMDFASKISL
jgi:serine/threonine protein kinase